MAEVITGFRAATGDLLSAHVAIRKGWEVIGGTNGYSGLLEVLFYPHELSVPNTPLSTVAERLTGPMSLDDQLTVFRSDEGETAVLYEGQPGRAFRLLTHELIDIREG